MCYAIVLSTDSKTDLSKHNSETLKFIKEPVDISENQILKYKNYWYLESVSGCSCTFRFGFVDTSEFLADEEWMNTEAEAVTATKKFCEMVRKLLNQNSQVDCVISWMDDGYVFSTEKKKINIDLSKIDDSEFWFFNDHYLNFVL